MQLFIWITAVFFSLILASPLPVGNENAPESASVSNKETSPTPGAPLRIDSIAPSDRTNSDVEFSIVNTGQWDKIETWREKGSLAVKAKNKHTLTEAVDKIVLVLAGMGAQVNQKKAKELVLQSTLNWDQIELIWEEIAGEVKKGQEAAKEKKRQDAEAAAEIIQTRLVLMKRPLLGVKDSREF